MQIKIDNIKFDVLADHYAKRGFKELPATPTMSAFEILGMRGQDSNYWVVEEDARGAHGRIWGQEAPRHEDHGEWFGGGWDATHRPMSEAIILRDGMVFATLPPCGY